jgi:hypothetical protein
MCERTGALPVTLAVGGRASGVMVRLGGGRVFIWFLRHAVVEVGWEL